MFSIVMQNNSVSTYLCNLVNLIVKKEMLNHKGCMEGSLVVFVKSAKKKNGIYLFICLLIEKSRVKKCYVYKKKIFRKSSITKISQKSVEI